MPCSEASAPWLLGDTALMAEYCLQVLTSDGEGSGAPGLSGQAPPPHTGPMEGWARGFGLSCPGPEPLPAQGPEPSCFRGTSMRGPCPADPAEGAGLLQRGLHRSLYCCPVVAAAEPMAQPSSTPSLLTGASFITSVESMLGNEAAILITRPSRAYEAEARREAWGPSSAPPPYPRAVCRFLQLCLSPLGQWGRRQAAPVSKPSPRNKQGRKEDHVCPLRRPVSPAPYEPLWPRGALLCSWELETHRFGRVGSPGPWAPTARTLRRPARWRCSASDSGRSKQTFCWGGADVNFSSGSGDRAQGQV